MDTLLAYQWLLPRGISKSSDCGTCRNLLWTTALTKTRNRANVDPSVLATSNGHIAVDNELGSTSPGPNKNGAQGRGALVGGSIALALAVVAGWFVLGARF